MSRGRLRLVLVALMAIAAATACGDSDSTTMTNAGAPPDGTTSAPDNEEEAWEEYEAEQSGEIEVEFTSDGRGRNARRVLVRVDGEDRIVNVAEFDGRQWTTIGEVVLPPPPFEFGGGKRTIQFGDVTTDGETDYLVPLEATQDIGVVISADGDREWRALPVRGADGVAREPYFGIEPRYENGELVSVERICDPTCAEGKERLVTWHYADGELTNTAG